MPVHINYSARKFSRRATMPHYRAGSKPYRHATRSIAARKIQRAWRWKKHPQSSYIKNKRSVNKPNQVRFRGQNMVEGHKFIGSFNNKMLKGLTGSGILEKRLIQHSKVNYATPSLVATSNLFLRSMSGYIANYSSVDLNAEDLGATTGIPAGNSQGAFSISTSTSTDRYVFFKNFQTEITLTTEASTFAGVPDPTSATQLGYVNQLNFRVILLKRKAGLNTGNSSGVPNVPVEATLANSLLLGYDNIPFGFNREYGQPVGTGGSGSAPIDVMLGKLSNIHWQVLQDKQFPLSVPVANVAGAESKYPNMKKLVFKHPINEKVLVSNRAQGTFPMDLDDKYMCVILAGLPNSSNAVLQSSTGLVPTTNRLWKVSMRGFTSYLDA